SLAAHEFFHLWNVKRIRPQGLEPVDYVHGNDTSDLWFSEGVTSTYGELALLRAGLVARRDFYAHVADEIHDLEERPARKFQSVIRAGREAWLERYADYSRPDRSSSYDNKRELLGFLAMRRCGGAGIRIASVEPGSSGEKAGLARGDVLMELNGDPLRRLPAEQLAGMKPGKAIKVQVRRGSQILNLKFALGRTTG